MADHRIVQCFGVKRRPYKPDKICRRKYVWTARASGKHHFGRRGAQACPHCGTMPDFTHPYNRYLEGSITFEEAKSMMPEWEAEKKNLGRE